MTSKSPPAAEAFNSGRQLFENLRQAEAEAQFRKAIGLDPDFALAHAYLGAITPGAEGDRLLDRAATLSAKVPEPERLVVESFVAFRHGDEEKARAAQRRVAELAPDDWRAQFAWGGQLSAARKWSEAAAALRKATQLNPKAGPAYNSLGYAELAQGHNDEAIAAFKRYAEANPTEPNAVDEALKQLAVAMDRGTQSRLPGGAMNALRRATLVGRVEAEARLGQAYAAQKTLAVVEAEANKAPANAQLQSNAHFARGAAALARGDAKAAAAHFAGCNDDDTHCQWYLLQAQEKAGDAAGADATRRKLLAANRRDGVYLVVRSQLTKQK
ncbi:MAG TPA: tetratricopeptide repeat protein [Gemmatimonadales bacterium]|nr:tetratricopeptide repeat protein [Gemmatimonadales bacterium]